MLKPRPESGLDWLICSKFVRQRADTKAPADPERHPGLVPDNQGQNLLVTIICAIFAHPKAQNPKAETPNAETETRRAPSREPRV